MDTDEHLMAALPPAAMAEVAALARRMQNASGPMMRLMNRIGAQVEGSAGLLPPRLREGLGALAESLLEQVYHGAVRGRSLRLVPKTDARLHRLAALASGAAGGSAGIGSALLELPATVALIFAAMQKIAAEEGFDPERDEVRLTCIEILGAGGPGRQDDAVETTFFGARLGLTGGTLQAVIARIAPRFATLLGQKLASQAVPLLGAAAGAGVNWLFVGYFQDMARVRFGLLRLSRLHGEAAVHDAFRAETARRVSSFDA
jgi:hypothetical protein